ncbi:hypothetical protein [Riemerella anatipestifer]|nr:hypothetical protein [Riemerella anatipestifer]
MNKFLSTLFLVFSVIVFSQSTQDLDLKNGFKQFKFGSSPAQIKNIIPQKNQYSQNPNVKTYDYVGNDIQYIANVKVDNVILYFFKNKLFLIGANFGNMESQTDFTYVDYRNILSWLEQAYGKDWIQPNNSDGVILNGAIWDGKKVKLELIRVDFSKSITNPENYGYISGYISVFDKNLNKQRYSDEF